MAAERNLLFFCTRGKQFSDFRSVAERIRRTAPDIHPHVFTTRQFVAPLLKGLWLARLPSISIEMDHRGGRPRLWRGARFGHPSGGGKMAQYELFDRHGIPSPKWTPVIPGISLDPEEWGRYVVVKPSHGGRGAYVRIHKTGRVRYRPPEDYPEGHPGRRGPMLAQQFVYTGPWPVCYRVLTYFGEPVSALRYEGRRDLPPLASKDGVREAGGGLSIVASAKGCTVSLTGDADLLELGRRTHALFPTTPSLGIDYVRDHATGKLYVTEVNGGGHSWNLTSDAGLAISRQFGLDFHGQFGALDLIARRSIEMAREFAH